MFPFHMGTNTKMNPGKLPSFFPGIIMIGVPDAFADPGAVSYPRPLLASDCSSAKLGRRRFKPPRPLSFFG